MSPITEAVSLRTAVIWHLCQAQSEQHGYTANTAMGFGEQRWEGNL